MTLLELAQKDIPSLKEVTDSFSNDHGAQVFVFDNGHASVTVLGNSFLIVENPSSLLRKTIRRGVFNQERPIALPIIPAKKPSWISRLAGKAFLN